MDRWIAVVLTPNTFCMTIRRPSDNICSPNTQGILECIHHYNIEDICDNYDSNDKCLCSTFVISCCFKASQLPGFF